MSNGRDLLTKAASILSFKSFVNYKVNGKGRRSVSLSKSFQS